MEGKKGDQHCMVVEWSIENFTCWNYEDHGKSIVQDIMRIDEILFHLELYPKGIAVSDEYVVVRVYDKICVNNCEFSIIDSKGSLLWKKTIRNPTWKDDYLEIPTSIIFKDVVENTVQDPMFKDVITLRYTRKGLDNVVHHDHTKVDAFEKFFRIPSEILKNLPVTKKINDSFFSYILDDFRQYRFCVSSIQSTVDGIECSFELHIPYQKGFFHCYLYVLNSDNSSAMFKTIKHTWGANQGWKFKYLLPKDIIEEIFSIFIRLKIIYGSEYINNECTSHDPKIHGISSILHSSAEHCSKSVIEQKCIIESEESLLSKELMCLYQDHDFSDFHLRCGDVTFPVHKNILSARSPVFKCVLTSDTREVASGCLDIEDLDPHTLGRFLAYLYSGDATVEAPLEWEGALKLYYAADKYQVPSLKAECAAVLKEQVSVSNVCDILSLADKHKDEMLKSEATDFIWRNYAKVLESKEWESFMLKDSLLLCKTLTLLGREKIHGK